MTARSLAAVFAIAGCGATHMPGGAGEMDTAHHGAGETGAADGGDSDGGDDGGPVVDAEFDLPAAARVNDGSFATSAVCADCHSNADGAGAMRDETGAPIGPDDLWRGTMMANSARDPFWWAMVRAEAVATPSLAAEIENECTKCHAPMGSIREDLYGGPMRLDDLLAGDDRSRLGLDGVACASCHQIPAGDVLGPPPLPADGRIYGPHAEPFTMPMERHTGFVPTFASHTAESAMCGTCHTLRTEPRTADGSAVGGHFSEQAPYLEWRNSVFSTEAAVTDDSRSCADCHVPRESAAGLPLSTRIARHPMGGDFPPVGDRSPYGRHVMVGGNTWVPAMLRDFADELRPRATAADFDATIAASRQLLGERTATVTIANASRDGEVIALELRVDSEVGHKFPSGIPARRAWLRVEVRDAAGTPVFRSGGVDGQGRLVDGAGTVLDLESVGGPIEPHHDVIDDDARVQIYESVLADPSGAPSFRLLRATSYAKDNRILPAGWRADGPHADETAPVLGRSDADFVGGADTVTYRVVAPADAGPYAVEASLWYQPIAARFAAELFALDAPEIRAFERIWAASDRTPETVAVTTTSVP